nr:calcium-activated potassium channel slowpoke-like [Penaeus vannamei]
MKRNMCQFMDLVLNLCFMCPFFVRMVIENNLTHFMTSCYTIADYSTIPPAILGAILGRSFTGLRFMRSLYLLKVPELYIRGTVETTRGFLIRKYLAMIFVAWFVMTGLVHLFEGLGDPLFFKNPHTMTYATWLYFSVVTVSTVGYGDFTCKTMIGRCLIVLCIVSAISSFAMHIPELNRLLSKPPPGFLAYVPVLPSRHIVFCGYLNNRKICSFFTNRIDMVADLVFLGESTPYEEDEIFTSLRGLHPVQGLLQDGCQLAAIHEARACIFLSNERSIKQEEEDFRNISAALSVSGYTTSPIHLELLQCKNKTILDELFQSRDECCLSVFCYAEFKLRLIGYSCLVPGFSTLLANLILPDVEKDIVNQTPNLSWEKEYNFGRSSSIYMTHLSASFENLTLDEAVNLCYSKLGLILLGIKTENGNSNRIIIYPSNPHFVIPQKTLGFFCTREVKKLKRAELYCSFCQDSKGRLDDPCKCDKKKKNLEDEAQDFEKTLEMIDENANGSHSKKVVGAEPLEVLKENFVGSSEKRFNECIKTHDEMITFDLRGHVVIFIIANQDSPAIGLQNLCQPLRSNCIRNSHLHRIIIMGPLDYLRKEWGQLWKIPEIYFADGYPWDKETREMVKLATCQMCIILNAEPGKLDSRFNMAFEVLKETSRQLGRLVNKGAPGGTTTMDGQCNYCQRLPIFISHVTDEPMTPANDTFAVAVGRTIPPALCHSFPYLNYDKSDILSFVSKLLQGGLSPESLVEQRSAGSDQVLVRLLDIETSKEKTYGDVFCLALQSNILCLGLYRQVRELAARSEEPPLRYVVTDPEDDFEVYSTDLVFALCRRGKV